MLMMAGALASLDRYIVMFHHDQMVDVSRGERIGREQRMPMSVEQMDNHNIYHPQTNNKKKKKEMANNIII